MPLSDGEKERIKLGANYLNGIAIGMFLVGGLSIPTAILLSATDAGTMLVGVALALFSMGISPYIHLRAKGALKELDE